MARDFNDFIYKLEHDELVSDEVASLLKEVRRFGANEHDPEDRLALMQALVKDYVLIYLRAYDEWATRGR